MGEIEGIYIYMQIAQRTIGLFPQNPRGDLEYEVAVEW